LKLKNQNDIDKLFILCKEGIRKNAIDEFSEHRLVVNKYFVGAILQSDFIMESIKRELRKINQSIKPENEEILSIIKNDILKRELLDSPEAIDSLDKYNKVLKKIDRDKSKIIQTQKSKIEETNIIINNVEVESTIPEIEGEIRDDNSEILSQ